MPYFWGKLTKECLREMVKGYWWGDGHVTESSYGFRSVSEKLAREVQSALLRLDILSGIGTSENAYGEVYSVSVPLVLSERFKLLVDDTQRELHFHKKPKKRFRETNTHFLVQVREVESVLWEGEVFNLKVQGKESYTVNGIAVHNCQAAREKGYKILVDTSIECKHIGYAQSKKEGFAPLETYS